MLKARNRLAHLKRLSANNLVNRRINVNWLVAVVELL